MSAPLLDADARSRAVTELDRSFAVEAGAGTGKTRVIVERVVHLVASGSAELPEIAVITFTETAAMELEEKIRTHLAVCVERERKGLEPESAIETERAERLARLTRAAADVDRAPIRTIHGFAAELLRLRPIEAVVDPRFSVADAQTTRRLRDEVFDAFLAAEASPGSARLKEILEAGVGPAALRALAVKMADNRDAVGAGGRSKAIVPGGRVDASGGDNASMWSSGVGDRAFPIALRPDPFVFVRELREWVRNLKLFASAHCAVPGDMMRARIEQAASFLELLVTRGRGSIHGILMREKPPVTIGKKFGAKPNWDSREALDHVREEAEEWKKRFSAYRAALGARITGETALWIEGYLNAYEIRKEREGLLDFQDLLLKARDLLCLPDVAADLRRSFRFVLVDEFQDTDPLQVEIVALLAGAGAARDWKARTPAPGAVFIVGDPKQSIYRFRRADTTMYRTARAWLERVSPDLPFLSITTNFRCRPRITSWVNAVFARLMGEEYAPIDAYRPDAEGSGVVYLTPDHSTEGDTSVNEATPAGAPERREREARMIARAAAAMVGSGSPYSIEDQRSGAMRPVRAGDIALLFRARHDMALCEEALRGSGIRCRTLQGRHFFARPEVSWFTSLLRAIENPHDEVAVVAALRGPFLACSDAEILEVRLARGRLDPLEQSGAVDAAGPALERLAGWHRRRNDRPVGVEIRALLEETAALLIPLLRSTEANRGLSAEDEPSVLNMAKIAGLARRHEDTGGTFRSFTRWLSGAIDDRIEEAEAPVLDADEDTVRLMTIHAAKGLEFPVVILPDLAREPRRREEVVVERQRSRLEFRLKTSGGAELASAGFAETWEAEKAELAREQTRLLYVAATRARDLLVLPFPTAEANTGFLAELERAGALLGEDGEPPEAVRPWVRVLRVPAGPGAPDAAVSGAGGKSASALEHARAEEKAGSAAYTDQHDSLVDPGNDHRGAKDGFHVPASVSPAEQEWEDRRRALLAEASKGKIFLAASHAPGPASGEDAFGPEAVSRAAIQSDLPGVAGEEALSAHEARGFGLAVHAVLEKADLASAASIGPLAQWAAHTFGLPSRAGEIEAMALSALRLPAIRDAHARRAFREVPVSCWDGSVMLDGMIDLVYEGADGALVVVDFKTDAVADEASACLRAKRYGVQMALYALALERATGMKVLQTAIVFLAIGLELRSPFDEEMRSLATAALARRSP